MDNFQPFSAHGTIRLNKVSLFMKKMYYNAVCYGNVKVFVENSQFIDDFELLFLLEKT